MSSAHVERNHLPARLQLQPDAKAAANEGKQDRSVASRPARRSAPAAKAAAAWQSVDDGALEISGLQYASVDHDSAARNQAQPGLSYPPPHGWRRTPAVLARSAGFGNSKRARRTWVLSLIGVWDVGAAGAAKPVAAVVAG